MRKNHKKKQLVIKNICQKICKEIKWNKRERVNMLQNRKKIKNWHLVDFCLKFTIFISISDKDNDCYLKKKIQVNPFISVFGKIKNHILVAAHFFLLIVFHTFSCFSIILIIFFRIYIIGISFYRLIKYQIEKFYDDVYRS